MSINIPSLANPVAPLYRHCGICTIEQKLLRCMGCKVIQYCSKEHQTAHWAEHKSTCTRIKRYRNGLERQERDLHATPNDPFVTGVGHFWGLDHTRDYMTARYRLTDAILEVKTVDAAELSLDHFVDMLRLCRGDDMGVRNLVPSQLLRLGRDQEAYDFMKWYATTGEEGDYDWGDMSQPFLDVKGADVFEPVDLFCRKYLHLNPTVSVTLLKIRLLLVIKECLRNVAVLRESGSLPTELFDQVQVSLLRIVLGEKWEAMRSTQCLELVDILSSQVDRLCKAVKLANRHFWPALLKPGRHLEAHLEPWSRGTVEEMQLVLQRSYDSWRESPGALELIAAKT